MAQEYPRSAWYDQSLPNPAPVLTEPVKKKNRGLKVLLLILAVVIVGAVALYVTTDGFTNLFLLPDPVITVPDADPRYGRDSGEDEDAEDYRGYFRSRIIEDTEKRSGSKLDQAKLTELPELELQSAEGQEALSLQELYRRCADSVVGVRAEYNGKLSYAWGTGIVMSADGCILTNEHVIDEADRAVVVMADGSEYPALLVGEDVQTDIALLKIDAPALRPAEFGDSAELTVGDQVAAIGNPLSDTFTNSLTDGIVSAIDRDVTVSGRTMTLLQTNAALNEGNSGGALLNMYGQVVGITNMKMVNYYSDVTVEGIGFAIPTATVKSVVDQLLTHGKVVGRPGLGITVMAVSEAVSERYDIPKGLFVSSVTPRSDAEAKGILPDDIIIEANGQPIEVTQDLLDIRNALSVGDSLSLTIWRDGEIMEFTIRVMDQNELY